MLRQPLSVIPVNNVLNDGATASASAELCVGAMSERQRANPASPTQPRTAPAASILAAMPRFLETTSSFPSEQSFYKRFDMQFSPAELREGLDEISLSRKEMLPRLITEQDIRGDLHAHTVASDCADSLEDMATAARSSVMHILESPFIHPASRSPMGNQLITYAPKSMRLRS